MFVHFLCLPKENERRVVYATSKSSFDIFCDARQLPMGEYMLCQGEIKIEPSGLVFYFHKLNCKKGSTTRYMVLPGEKCRKN